MPTGFLLEFHHLVFMSLLQFLHLRLELAKQRSLFLRRAPVSQLHVAGRHALNVLYAYTRKQDLAIRRLNPQNNVHTVFHSVHLVQSRGPAKFTVASLYGSICTVVQLYTTAVDLQLYSCMQGSHSWHANHIRLMWFRIGKIERSKIQILFLRACA